MSWLAFVFSICAACSNGNDESAESTSSSLDANEFIIGSTSHETLFHDKMQFTREDLISGSTNCSDILDENHIEDQIITWPPELKRYLIEVLEQFPRPDLVSESVHGIYLVTDAALVDQKSMTTAAGLACDRGIDYKGIIFLNYNSMMKKRMPQGVANWQNSRSKTNKFIEVKEGDTAAITLMHEIFHAIDVKMLMHGTPDNIQKRAHFKSRSWVGNVPKHRRGEILSLNDNGNTDSTASDHRCRHPIHFHSELNLITNGSDPKSLAKELQNLQDQSNFIVPYTMASPAEDFAETLTVYYFGVFFQSWQKRTVSLENKPIFVHDTELILRTKKQQIDKACAAAQLVFGDCQLR